MSKTKEVVELEFKRRKEASKIEFDFKMKVLEYMRQTEKMKHEWELERQRIRSAEIRKTQERRYYSGG